MDNKKLQIDNEKLKMDNDKLKIDNDKLYSKISRRDKQINNLYKSLIDTIKKNNGGLDGYCNIYPCRFEIIDNKGCHNRNCSDIHIGTCRYYIMLMLIYRDSLNKCNKDSKNYKRETTFERYITRKNIHILRHYTTNKPLNVAAINIEKMKKDGKYIYDNCFYDYKMSNYDNVIKFLEANYDI